jgi:hypothetical protein
MSAGFISMAVLVPTDWRSIANLDGNRCPCHCSDRRLAILSMTGDAGCTPALQILRSFLNQDRFSNNINSGIIDLSAMLGKLKRFGVILVAIERQKKGKNQQNMHDPSFTWVYIGN